MKNINGSYVLRDLQTRNNVTYCTIIVLYLLPSTGVEMQQLHITVTQQPAAHPAKKSLVLLSLLWYLIKFWPNRGNALMTAIPQDILTCMVEYMATGTQFQKIAFVAPKKPLVCKQAELVCSTALPKQRA